jgi:hypothetical protein
VGVTGGGAIGIVAAKTPVAAIVPTFGLSGVYERVSVSSGSVSVSNSTNYGVASIGVGFVFTDQLALVPTVAVPFGLTGGNAEFVLTLSYNFRMR